MASRPMGGGPGGHGPGGIGRRIEKAKDPRGALVRLAGYLRPYVGLLGVVVLFEILNTGLSLATPALLGRGIDAMGQPNPVPALLRIAGLMAGAYIGSALAQFGQNYVMAGVAQKALRTLRADLFMHLQLLSLRFFDSHTHGELMSRLTNDIDAVARVLNGTFTQLVTSALTVVGILVMMFAINVWLALASLLVIPLMFLLTLTIARRTRQSFRGLQSELAVLNGQMEETVSGARVVQAYHQQETAIAEFVRANNAVRNIGFRAQALAMLVMPMMTVLSNVNQAVLAGVGAWLVLRGMASVGTIATFIVYGRRFTMPLRSISEQYNAIQAALAGAERVFEAIDEVPDLEDVPGAPALDAIEGHVEFDHVDFSYVPGVPVLKDVTLEARPGEVIALVGPTGAGKTTIVNLLSRFYDVQYGAIRVDGHDIRQVQKASLRRQLGVVLQDTFLFSTSVMENIRYGRLDATDEECIAAAKLANADQFITRLPEGYNTQLSERGSNLSQGQRQLLAIARAALADPAILILDEATSSVDTRTEAHIQEALLKLMEGRTSFVIAHRLSTIRNADHVLVINNGEIIERGTHKSLLADRGFYYRLFISQFRGQAAEEVVLSEPA